MSHMIRTNDRRDSVLRADGHYSVGNWFNDHTPLSAYGYYFILQGRLAPDTPSAHCMEHSVWSTDCS